MTTPYSLNRRLQLPVETKQYQYQAYAPSRPEMHSPPNSLYTLILNLSRVISRVIIVITHVRGLITPLIATHEPPSRLPHP